jgi:hypothetical protein
MKINKIFLGILVLISLNLSVCLVSEWSWSIKVNGPDALRKLVGLPSVAVGDLNPAARNPGLEPLCASFYDVPGGYCSYFAQGVSVSNLTLACNVTEVANK